MKFLSYIIRNSRRNPIRTLLTIASISICLFLMMILISFISINDDIAAETRGKNRLLSMSSQGFGQPVPIARVREIAAMDGVVAASPMSWFGGKFRGETMPFAQFGVWPEDYLKVYGDEVRVPPDQAKDWFADKSGCVIGRKLAEERNLKIGEKLPLEKDIYPVDLTLNIRGIYDGPARSDLRMALFHWDCLDDEMKRTPGVRATGNAGIVALLCKNSETMTALSQKIDELYKNSDAPLRTQTEEAFIKMFSEMFGDMRLYILWVGVAVVFALICVAGVSMAMSMRERTTEIAVLKAIGYGKGLVLALVLIEAMIVAGLGGLIGAFGTKSLFDAFDVSRLPGVSQFLPFFYIPWATAGIGFAASLLIGFVSGVVPAFQASRLSVIDGLRKVV